MSSWVVKIEQELSTLPKKEDPPERIQTRRMYRIPNNTEGYGNQEFVDVYRPYKVSVGPRHNKGEYVKKDCLLHVLRRPGKPLESYFTALRDVVDDMRDAYNGLHPKWRNDNQLFLEMIFLDACFVLEFMYVKSRSAVNPVISRILENHGEMKCYLHDFLLLENQVPLRFLEKLLTVGGWGSVSTQDKTILTNYLALIICANEPNFVGQIPPEGKTRKQKYFESSLEKRRLQTQECVSTFMPINRVAKIEHAYKEFDSSLHILDVNRRILVHTPRRKKPQVDHIITNIPSATELHKIRIVFTISETTSLLDVSLNRKILKLPKIVVDSTTKSKFLNLTTFEQLHKDVVTSEVTSYMYFMGCLVQAADDARLLQSCGIIVTTLPSFEVTKLFRRMCRDISLDPDDSLAPEYMEMLTTVRGLYNKKSNQWRKDLFQTYLRSPWAIMSVIAAVLLFTLSVIQTVYTVLSYVRPK